MKLERLLGILTVLLQTECVTAPLLAARFEVSRRTISRDIDALCLAGIPVVTRQGGGGGISIAKGYKLDKSVLTTQELENILVGLKGLGTVTENSQLQRVLEKFGVDSEAMISLQEPVVIDLASYYKGDLTRKIACIKDAIRRRKMISFTYFSEKGQQRRCIEPCFILFQWSAWYVFGYCADRQDWRLFKLTRLWELKTCETEFLPREIPPEKRDFHAGFPDDRRLVALCDPSIKYQLIDSYGLECITEIPDGRLRLEVGYTNHDYIVSWLLSFGAKVTVQQPDEVAQAIAQEAKKILSVYQ